MNTMFLIEKEVLNIIYFDTNFAANEPAGGAPELDLWGRDVFFSLNFWLLFFAMAIEDGYVSVTLNSSTNVCNSF